jgi:hypothetical protein
MLAAELKKETSITLELFTELDSAFLVVSY